MLKISRRCFAVVAVSLTLVWMGLKNIVPRFNIPLIKDRSFPRNQDIKVVDRVKRIEDKCEEHRERLHIDEKLYAEIENKLSFTSVSNIQNNFLLFKMINFSQSCTTKIKALPSSGVKHPRLHLQAGPTSSSHNGKSK